MRVPPRSTRSFLVALVASLTPSIVAAQSISIALRGSGSVPTGAFADAQSSSNGNAALIAGAKSGFGYGLDVGLSYGMFGIYAGFDHVAFDCETTTCSSDGKYTLQGVTAGVKLSATSSTIRPFVKGGVTFNDLQGGYGASSSNVLTADRAPGYEIGVGVDVVVLPFVSVSPQVRYIGQNFKARIPGVTAPAATGQGVNYVTFDLGLSFHTPFGK